MGTENLISQENAEQQFSLLDDYYEKNHDEISEQEESVKRKLKSILINAIQKGRLEITEGGDGLSVVQTLKGGEKLNWAEMNAKAKLEREKVSGDMSGLYAMAGSLTGLGMVGILKLKGKDLDTVEAITSFLYMD